MTLTTFGQMVAAELLKLRRRRAIIAIAALFTIGVVGIWIGVMAIQHAVNPIAHGPAGGVQNFDDETVVLSVFFGALAAILIGAEAGTADLGSGVFRDLVVTGRSRLWLYAVRVPAALIVTLTLGGLALALALAASFVFADGLPTPSASFALDSVLWTLGAEAMLCVIAVGVGSWSGSRATSLTTLIGGEVVASRLLARISSLGSARSAIPDVALGGLKPGNALPDSFAILPSAETAVVVIALWVLVWLAVGAWRTQVRDA